MASKYVPGRALARLKDKQWALARIPLAYHLDTSIKVEEAYARLRAGELDAHHWRVLAESFNMVLALAETTKRWAWAVEITEPMRVLGSIAGVNASSDGIVHAILVGVCLFRDTVPNCTIAEYNYAISHVMKQRG